MLVFQKLRRTAHIDESIEVPVAFKLRKEVFYELAWRLNYEKMLYDLQTLWHFNYDKMLFMKTL